MASSPEIRKLNKRNAYRYIYQQKECSKQDIAYSLGQSLPTVIQNLKELQEEGMVHTAGLRGRGCGDSARACGRGTSGLVRRNAFQRQAGGKIHQRGNLFPQDRSFHCGFCDKNRLPER